MTTRTELVNPTKVRVRFAYQITCSLWLITRLLHRRWQNLGNVRHLCDAISPDHPAWQVAMTTRTELVNPTKVRVRFAYQITCSLWLITRLLHRRWQNLGNVRHLCDAISQDHPARKETFPFISLLIQIFRPEKRLFSHLVLHSVAWTWA